MCEFSIAIAPIENIYFFKQSFEFKFYHLYNVYEFNIIIVTLNNKDTKQINNNNELKFSCVWCPDIIVDTETERALFKNQTPCQNQIVAVRLKSAAPPPQIFSLFFGELRTETDSTAPTNWVLGYFCPCLSLSIWIFCSHLRNFHYRLQSLPFLLCWVFILLCFSLLQ